MGSIQMRDELMLAGMAGLSLTGMAQEGMQALKVTGSRVRIIGAGYTGYRLLSAARSAGGSGIKAYPEGRIRSLSRLGDMRQQRPGSQGEEQNEDLQQALRHQQAMIIIQDGTRIEDRVNKTRNKLLVLKSQSCYSSPHERLWDSGISDETA